MTQSLQEVIRDTTRIAVKDPSREGELQFTHLTVGALVRKSMRNLFRHVEVNGGVVEYRHEYKSFLETTYTDVRIKGNADLLLIAALWLEELGLD